MIFIKHNQHTISKKYISKNALKVLYRLNQAGYDAYLVGGGVRDLLLKKKPKDFDVTTSATPNQIRKLFRNCRLVGKRFRLAHIIFNSEIIEVATFRGRYKEIISDKINLKNKEKNISFCQNTFGSIEEDVQRRDFTINSLYYSVDDLSIRDYIGGIKDLKKGVIRFIGNSEISCQEDPVRMLRAVRFAAKLNMHISQEASESISRLAILINNVSPARLFEETLKLFQTGFSYETYKLLNKYQLFQTLFPTISKYFTDYDGNSLMEKLIAQVLKNTDNYIYHDGCTKNPSFLFASIFWYPLLKSVKYLRQKNCISYHDAFILASNDVLNEACQFLAIPKSVIAFIRNIWKLQICMSYRYRKLAWKLIEDPKFGIAYNLLSLRAEIEKKSELQHLVKWWKEFYTSTSQEKNEMVNMSNSNLILKHYNYRHLRRKHSLKKEEGIA